MNTCSNARAGLGSGRRGGAIRRIKIGPKVMMPSTDDAAQIVTGSAVSVTPATRAWT